MMPSNRSARRLSIPRKLSAAASLAFAALLATQCQNTSAKVSSLRASAQIDAARTQKPNIVFVMADELGYFELSCMGHPKIRTPNLDRLVARGLRFTQCLAGSPLCAPTRATLMTGKHSGHTSVRTNGGGTPLRQGEETIASVLKKSGYATGGFGKWGCGGRGSTGVPEEHGFDTFFGYYDQVHAHTYYPAYLIRNSEEHVLPGNRGGRKGETYAHYAIVDAAKDFIRKNHERPFFCYMPVTPPHGFFDIPDDDPALKYYETKVEGAGDWPVEARRYAAMVTMLDRQVGEIVALLEELGVDENTLLVFGGDNGGKDYFKDREHPRGFHAPNVDPRTGVEFRGQKGVVYEGGLRVPMLAYWPGKIRGGQVSDHLSYFPDFMPTLAELAGAQTPADSDGISLVPTLLDDGRAQREHEYLYWELGGQRAVRAGHWKAVRARAKAPWSLYDLRKDISEKNDVAAEHPDVLERLQAFAESAHTPAVPGSFTDRSQHEKDRRARGAIRRSGKRRRGGRAGSGKVHTLSGSGIYARDAWRIARVSSENEANGKVARAVLDGDPRTHWHSRFSDKRAEHPHEIVIDMGETKDVAGLAYLARQDGAWNGALGRCTLHVGDDLATLLTDPAQQVKVAEFAAKREAQTVRFAKRRGRFVALRILSGARGGPWASIAELGVLPPPKN